MSEAPVVDVVEVSKRFKLYANPWLRAREWLPGSRACHHSEVWALRNVSFRLRKGQCLGIIGRNGSGKSTLLKILTGVMTPTTGTIATHGRVLALLELGAGFNMELSGRQNVITSAALMAFPPNYARERMAEIEAFADLGEYFDYPVKTYSSGMFVRLAFSTFLHLDPDIFIVDEALSVGDVFFQQKCAKAVRQILDRGTTMLFVSHDLMAVQNLCHEAILLDHGELVHSGRPEEVISLYYDSKGPRKASALKRAGAPDAPPGAEAGESGPEGTQDAWTAALREAIRRDSMLNHATVLGSGGARLVAARLVDGEGRKAARVRVNEWLTFQLLVEADEDVAHPSFGIALYDRMNRDVFCIGTSNLNVPVPAMARGDVSIVGFRVRFSLSPGEYTCALAVANVPPAGSGEATFLDNHVNLGPIMVYWDLPSTLPFYGMAYLETELEPELRVPGGGGTAVAVQAAAAV